MSAKVDNMDVTLPEASPDANDKKLAESQESGSASRRNLWIGLFALLTVTVAIIVVIAVPLSLKNKDGSEKSSANLRSPDSANATQIINGSASKYQCPAPTEGDDCISEESYKECMDLVNSGCERIYSTFSCPPLHRCGDEAAQQIPEPLPASAQCPTPSEGDDCITEESHKDCMDLVDSGCQMIVSTFSCPPLHLCGDEAEELVGSESSPSTTQCPAPTEGDTCITKDSHKECIDLVNNGCQVIYSTFSCPPQHRCGDEVSTGQKEELVGCTMELAYCADGTDVGRTGPNCEFEPCPDGGCPTDTFTCDDGTELFRDPALGCEFEKCPERLGACTREVAPCADGTPVGRSGPDCYFGSCPDGGCPIDTYTCDDGRELLRDPALGCEFATCPEEEELVGCTMELAYCADGTGVGRSGPNCEFEPCPDGDCPTDIFTCDDGTELFRYPALACEFEKCPQQLGACTREVAPCANGTTVGRSGPNCYFESCPDGGCPIDTYTCDDGKELLRDPALGCEFATCPEPVDTEVSRKADMEDPLLAACTMELAYCADGTGVGRSGPKCQFESCPDGRCPVDTYTCGDGTELFRDPARGCEFKKCPQALAACTREIRHCPDGTPIGRVGPKCEFEKCP